MLCRISLSDNEYEIIKPPVGVEASMRPEALRLGKSEKGVYCALVDGSNQMPQLGVWILKKLCDQMEWVLMNQVNLGSILSTYEYQIDGPWVLSDFNYRQRCDKGGEDVVRERMEWDSDNDNVLQAAEGGVAEEYQESIDFLGFHPYKEVVFLSESHKRGVAYHLNTSKVQDLGFLYPADYAEVASLGQFIRQLLGIGPSDRLPPSEMLPNSFAGLQ